MLDARPGDGTYVTSLAPQLLLENFSAAIDLLQDDTLEDVMQIRLMLEPVATARAALKMDEPRLTQLRALLQLMKESATDPERTVVHDIAFHRTIIAANDNPTLTSVLDGLSGRTVRARVWRGLIEGDAAATSQAEHQAIYDALAAGDPELAQATAFIHVNTSARWLERILREPPTP